MIVLANRFARPVVVAILGRFVLRSLGLLVVVVNAITIWLATLLVPDFIQVASPFILWVLVAATLYTVGSTVLMTLLGLNRPSTVAVGGGPSVAAPGGHPHAAAQLARGEPAAPAGLRRDLRDQP